MGSPPSYLFTIFTQSFSDPEPLSKYLQQLVTNVPSFTKLLFAIGISLPLVCSASTDGAAAACTTLC